jgi:hypothetical protein
LAPCHATVNQIHPGTSIFTGHFLADLVYAINERNLTWENV